MNLPPKDRAALILGNAPRALWLRYYKTDHWIKVRDQVMARSGGICELCRRRKANQVHHKHYRSLFNENINRDLVATCGTCHRKISK